MKLKEIKLFPRINKANSQINFQLKKSSLPKDMKLKLNNLKSIKINLEDFEFD
jgi:hypothetical protein